MSTAGSKRAVFAALIANLGIAVAKFAGFAITGSASLLAEAVHSVADTGNQLLLLLGIKRAKKPATTRHPFGFGRERYFWAFVVSIVLFTRGSVFAIFEGVNKLTHPHALESPTIAIVILVIAFGLEAFSFRTARQESNTIRGTRTWPAFIRESKTPELPVLLLEDFGALLGLAIALACVLLSMATGSSSWDGLGSCLIGALLGVFAFVLAVEMKSLLLGEAASDEDVAAIEKAIDQSPMVVSCIHLRTQHFGPDELLVGAKIEFISDLTMASLAAAIDDVERRIRSAVAASCVIYLEHDIKRSDAE